MFSHRKKNNGIIGFLKTDGVSRVVSLIGMGGVCISPLASALEKPPPSGEREASGPRHHHERGHQHEGWGRKDIRDGARDRPGKGGFKQLDLNKDGVLSFEEFSRARRLARLENEKRRRLFDFLDRNKDGKLQRAELRPREPRWLLDLRKNFKQLDTDQDESLDFEEFSRAKSLARKSEAERKRMFKRLDRDRNGSIQLAEIKYRPRHRPRPEIDFHKYDTDQSGGLDYAEYSKLPFVRRFPEERKKKHFAEIDKDGSGEISMDEIRAAHKRRPHPPRRGRHSPEKHRD